MNIYKYIWTLKTLFRLPFFGKIQMPSYIANPIFIGNADKIFIGKRTRILPHSRLEVYEKGNLIFEGDTSIGQNFHCTAGGNLIIRKGVTVAENVYISDIEHNLNETDSIVVERSKIIKETSIGEYCFIGYGAVILPGTTLGKNCIVGANSVVKGEFPDNSMIAGIPGRIIKVYNINTRKWEKTKF
jgi:acetyltransferase-like isoleucine patch superfamily enzyme